MEYEQACAFSLGFHLRVDRHGGGGIAAGR
jgi:hypothetical protein